MCSVGTGDRMAVIVPFSLVLMTAENGGEECHPRAGVSSQSTPHLTAFLLETGPTGMDISHHLQKAPVAVSFPPEGIEVM